MSGKSAWQTVLLNRDQHLVCQSKQVVNYCFFTPFARWVNKTLSRFYRSIYPTISVAIQLHFKRKEGLLNTSYIITTLLGLLKHLLQLLEKNQLQQLQPKGRFIEGGLFSSFQQNFPSRLAPLVFKIDHNMINCFLLPLLVDVQSHVRDFFAD